MSDNVLVIFGVTSAGARFRPSDWVERFCGVMAPYTSKYQSSGNVQNYQGVMGYSDLVFPATHDGDRVVMAFYRLNDIEPLAWEFVLNFAKENDLKTEQVDQSKILTTYIIPN